MKEVANYLFVIKWFATRNSFTKRFVNQIKKKNVKYYLF